MNTFPPLAVTMGDPSGIGPEIVAKTMLARTDLRRSVVVGDPAVMATAITSLYGPALRDAFFPSLIGRSGPRARRVVSKWFHSTAPAKSPRCAPPSRSASTIYLAAPMSTTSFPSLEEVVSATTPSPAALWAIPAFSQLGRGATECLL
ncbi:hypothetical protein A8M32_04720 [Sinorhizobium alkalisoli]|uniref:4-hydroxythreonine-4-phosphate dehydrogenase n=1 Tax=Sinorhizobium alkalisoli TaxID=1752398 RepID=A0A1E3VG12_9HYPH|nr:hypothetical protein A8M32_04720 [Sinorhizobium alkalisoli]